MPQQINLSTPVLLAQKRYFSAQAMLQTLALFVVLGGALLAYGVWSLRSATKGFNATLDAQAPELARLRAALAAEAASPGTGEKELNQELQVARGLLAERAATLDELRRGLMVPGFGHSARLQLVAQSIPAKVWVTEVQADASQLEVRGFTEEPAALNDWVAKLAQSPLLAGQKLTRVKVESAPGPPNASLARTEPATVNSVAAARQLWSFYLVSALTSVALPSSGGKP